MICRSRQESVLASAVFLQPSHRELPLQTSSPLAPRPFHLPTDLSGLTFTSHRSLTCAPALAAAPRTHRPSHVWPDPRGCTSHTQPPHMFAQHRDLSPRKELEMCLIRQDRLCCSGEGHGQRSVLTS